MILIEANIFMYAAGRDHKNKRPSLEFLEAVASEQVESATDVEVLQEILHRYRAINRWEDGKRVYDLVRQIVDVILPVTPETMDLTYEIMMDYSGLIARDALHLAVCRQHGIDRICSYDRDFDAIPFVARVTPEDILE